MEANGKNQVYVQALLSRAPTISITRRHGGGDEDGGERSQDGDERRERGGDERIIYSPRGWGR